MLVLVLFVPANFSHDTGAAPIDELNFQARLLNDDGSLVDDGTYNVEFKLYDTAAAGGSAQGVCSLDSSTDDCVWLETRTGGNQVSVANGYLYANLGSVTAFSTGTIDWSQELWLTINVGGTGAPSWDGEMTPRLKLTSVPHSFNSDLLDNLDSGDFVQLGQGVQTDATTNSSIFINKTSTGDYISLQDNGTEELNFNQNAELTLGSATDDGSLVLTDGNGESLTITSADIASDYTLTFNVQGNCSGANGGVLTIAGGEVICDDDDGGGAAPTLQSAYTNGNTITTTDTDNGILFNLADTTDDEDFIVDILGTGNTIEFRDGGNQALRVVDGGDVIIGDSTTDDGTLIFENATNSNTLTLIVGATSTNTTLTLPTADGNSGQCLKDSDGNGTLAFQNCNNGSGGGGAVTLDDVYEEGNLLDTSDNNDVDFVLTDTTTDSNFDIDIQADNTVSISRIDTASSEVPAQLLLLENLDSDITVVDAIDISGSNITNAINIGANNIVGTTPDLDFTNFDVVGASGNTTVGGTLTVGSTAVVQGATLTVGTTTQAGSIILHEDTNNETVTVNTGTQSVGSFAVSFPELDGNDTFCLVTEANCSGSDSFTTVTYDDGSAENVGAPTLDFQTSDFAITESPADEFNITIQAERVEDLTGAMLSGNTETGINVVYQDGDGTIDFTVDNLEDLAGTLDVASGGTGATTLTAGGVLFGNGTSAITASAVLANGELLIGDGAGSPAVATLTAGTDVTVTNGAGSITIGLTADSVGNDVLAFDTGQNLTTTDSPTFVDLLLEDQITFEGTAADANETILAVVNPTADITYQLADAAAGTYEICTEAGNCSGVAGNDLQQAYDASGTPATIDLATGKNLEINLTNVAADPDFIVDIATGSTGVIELQNNGTADFRVDSSGVDLIDVDVADFTGANVTFDVGEIINADLANSSLTYTAGTGLTGGGAVSLGGSATINVVGGTCITANADDIAITADCIDDAQIADNSLDATSLADGSVDTGELVDGGVAEVDLDITNAPGGLDNYVLTLNEGSGNFTWVDPSTIGSDTFTLVEEGDGGALNSAAPTLDFDGTDFNLTESPTDEINITIDPERIEDLAGAMLSGNTETGINVVYQDGDGTIDFTVDNLEDLAGTLDVASGGTGATTLTDGGILFGNGTGAIGATGVLANGQLLIGDGTEEPTLATLTGGTAITVTNGAGSIDIGVTADSIGDAQLAFDTGQALTTSSSPTFVDLNLQDTITFEGSAADANETVLSIVNPTADITYELADEAAGTYEICTTAGNCSGVAGNTLQQSYDADDDDGIAEIILTSTDGEIVIRDAASTIGDLFVVEANGGSDYFAVASTGITAGTSVTVTAGNSLTLVGGNTASRPGSPSEGEVYFDSETDTLLVYANGKWQAARGEYTIVAANDSTQAEQDAADYVADGTSDEDEINSALTDATGGKVLLLAGSYNVDASISIPNNTTLQGVGFGTDIELADLDATENIVENTDQSTGTGVVVRDLRIDGRNDLNNSGFQYGIYFDDVGDESADRAGGQIVNVYVERLETSAILLSSSESTVVQGSTTTDSGNGIQIATSSTNNTIDGNTSFGNSVDGIYVNNSSDYNVISNNTVSSNAGFGISLNSSSYNSLNGNVSNNNTGGSYELANNSNNNVVSGNSADDSTNSNYLVTGSSSNTISSNVGTGGFAGYALTSTAINNTITGNTTDGAGSAGIYIFSSSANNTISGNTIIDSGGATTNDGIHLNNADENIIIGNNIVDSSCSTNCYAIFIETGTSDDNYLADNTFDGGATINDAGTGTVYANQLNEDLDSATADLDIQAPDDINLNSDTVVTGTFSVSSTAEVLGASLTLGSTTQAGSLVIHEDTNNETVTINTGTQSVGSYTVSFPELDGNDTFCLVTEANCVGSGNTLQAAYNLDDDDGAAEIVLTSADGEIVIRDAVSTIGDLFVIEENGGTDILTVNSTAVTVAQDLTVTAGNSLTLVGGNTASRPGSPSEGEVYFDSETDTLLVYANGKWQAARGEYTIVAANDSTQAEQDAADYVADGTSDEDEINSALTDATGGKVLLLAGTYVADATILIPNDTTLQGVGLGTVIELADIDATDNLIENSDTSTGTGVVIRDLKLDGRDDLNTTGIQFAIDLEGMGSGEGASAVEGATITNIYVTRFGDNVGSRGINFDGSDNNTVTDSVFDENQDAIYISSSQNIVVSDSRFTDNHQGGGVGRDVYATSSEFIVIDSNYFDSAARPVALSSTTHSVISDNSFQDGFYNNIDIGSGSDYNTISGNVLEGSAAGDQILVSGADYNVFSGNVSNSANDEMFVVSTSNNNEFVGNVSQGDQGFIDLDTSDSNTVVGNAVNGAVQRAIRLDTANRNVISNNSVTGTGQATYFDAIYLVSSDENIISGNNLNDTNCITTCYAINITDSGSDDNYLSDNTFKATGGDAATINDTGTGTIYANQLNEEIDNATADLDIQAPDDINLNSDTVITGTIVGTSTAEFQGASLTVGTTSQAGSLILHEDTNNETVTINTGTQSVGSYTVSFPELDGNDTFCLVTEANCAGSGISGSGSSGQVAFWNGASSVTGENNFFWDSASDELGIGTNAPAAELEIQTDGFAGIFIQSDHDNAGAGGAYVQFDRRNPVVDSALIGPTATSGQDAQGNAYTGTTTGALLLATLTDDDVQIGSEDTVVLTVATDNQVGIGDNTPDATLDVVSAVEGEIVLRVQTTDATPTGQIFVVENSAGTDLIAVEADEDITIGNSLGIGTDAPAERLEIQTDGFAGIFIQSDHDNAGSGGSYIQFDRRNPVVDSALIGPTATAGQDAQGNAYTGTLTGALLLATLTDDAIQIGSEDTVVVTVSTDNRVGIGDNSPEALLDVQGAEGVDAVIRLDADDGDNAADRWSFISQATGNDLSIQNDGNERFNLTSAGTLQLNAYDCSAGDQYLTADASGVISCGTDDGGTGEWSDGGTFLFPGDLTGAEDIITGGETLGAADIILYATGAATFNEQGANADFRIEGDTDTDLFFVDADAESVGIGTNTPGHELHVTNTSGGTTILAVEHQTNDHIQLDVNGTSASLRFGSGLTGGQTIDVGGTANLFFDFNGGTEHIVFENGGGVLFNNTGANADFNIQSDTHTDAFNILGSSGQITLGALDCSAGDQYITANASGVLSCGTDNDGAGDVPYSLVAADDSPQFIKDLADYTADGTSDEDEINNALTDSTGGKVVLAEGTFDIDGTILVPNNTTLEGDGVGTVINTSFGAGSDNAIEATGASRTGQVIRNLRLDGSEGTAGTQTGIFALDIGATESDRAGITIENVHVSDFRTHGIELDDADLSIVSNNTVQNVLSFGILLEDSDDNVLADNILNVDAGTDGVVLDNSDRNSVVGNVSTNSNDGFHIYNDSDYNSITGNTASDNASYGFRSQTNNSNNTYTANTANGNGTGFESTTSLYDVYTGNIVEGNTNYGFEISTSSNFNTIDANSVSNNGTRGIWLNSTTDNIVSNNNVYDTGGATTNEGIYIGASDRNTIIGNHISDSSCSTTCRAINIVDSGSDDNYLADNTFDGGGVINDVGTGTVYANQLNEDLDSATADLEITAPDDINLNSDTVLTGTLEVSSTAVVQGASLTVGTTSQAGSLILHEDTNNETVTINTGTQSTGSYTVSFPVLDANDTFCLVTEANCAGGSGEWSDGGSFLYPSDLSGAEDIVIGATTTGAADIWLQATGAAIFNQTGADVDFNIESDTEQYAFYFDGTGDGALGLGTNAPSQNIHIQSDVGVGIYLEADANDNGEDQNPVIQFSQDGDTVYSNIGHAGLSGTDALGNAVTDSRDNAFVIHADSDSTLVEVQLATEGAVALTVSPTQLIGIGDNTPDADLEVSANGTSTGSALFVSSNDGNDGDLLDVRRNGDLSIDNDTFFFDASTDFLGIGINAPQHQIHIHDDGDASILLNADDNDAGGEDDNAFIKLQQDAQLVEAFVGLVGDPGDDPEGASYTSTLANSLLLGSTTGSPVQLGTSGVVGLTLDVNSQVGIGVTAPDAALEVGGARTQSAWGLNGVQLQAATATYTDSSTAASGTATNAAFVSIARPTLAATNASVTTTNAATLYIDDAPLAGTNQTITNPYALWVDDGNVRIDDDLTVSGVINVAGTVDTSFTQGSIVFAGASGVLSENNSEFFWDDTNEELGIGTNSPSGNLHIQSAGDTSIYLEADTNNSGEGDNPYIYFSQDGGVVYGQIGHSGGTNLDAMGGTLTGAISNALVIEGDSDSDNVEIQLATEDVVALTVSATQLIGIGDTTPEALLDVQGSEGNDAEIRLDADDGDNGTDRWSFISQATGNDLSIQNNGGERLNLTSTGHLSVTPSSDGTAVLSVQDSGGQSYLDVDTTNLGVEIGNGTDDVVLSLDAFDTDPSSAPDGSMFYDANDDVFRCRINGSWANCDTSGGGGIINRITIHPEYAGGTLYADGSNNSGTLSAGYDNTDRHNYYDWDSSNGSLQDYDIIVHTVVPSDFSTSNDTSWYIYALANSTDELNNEISVSVFEGATQCNTTDDLVEDNDISSANTWTEVNLGSMGSCTFNANDTIRIQIKLSSRNNNNVQIGEIRWDYDN